MTTGVGLIVQLLPLLGAQAPDTSHPYAGRGALEWEGLSGIAAVQDTPVTRPRAQAIEYSSGYNKRLKLHRILSFAMVPMFIGSYVTGDKLLEQGDILGIAMIVIAGYIAGIVVRDRAGVCVGVPYAWTPAVFLGSSFDLVT